MNRIEKMKAKREDLRLQAVGVLTKVEAEERALTSEEQNELNRLEGEIAQWDATIASEERLAALAPQSTAERSDGESLTANEVRGIVRAVPNKDNIGFRSFGEQLMAVYRSAMPGASVDERLSTRAASGLNETNPSDGGFLVQQDFVSDLLKKTYETGVLASRARKIPISTNANSLKINALDDDSRKNGCRWGGVQTYWENEADKMTASRPKFRTMELSLKKLTGLCYATDELLQDAAALESVIRQAFAEEFGFKIDDALLSGGGAGQPLGVLNSKALVTQAIEKDQTEKIMVENLIKMWARLWGRSRANAVWYVNQEIEPLLYTLKVGDKPVYIPAGGLSEAPYATLFGRPVIPLEQCSQIGTVGDILLGDFSQYLLIDKGGLNAQSSIHVRFLYDESVFRFIYRCDGQPIWSGPITPYKANNTLSPFVALATR